MPHEAVDERCERSPSKDCPRNTMQLNTTPELVPRLKLHCLSSTRP